MWWHQAKWFALQPREGNQLRKRPMTDIRRQESYCFLGVVLQIQRCDEKSCFSGNIDFSNGILALLSFSLCQSFQRWLKGKCDQKMSRMGGVVYRPSDFEYVHTFSWYTSRTWERRTPLLASVFWNKGSQKQLQHNREHSVVRVSLSPRWLGRFEDVARWLHRAFSTLSSIQGLVFFALRCAAELCSNCIQQLWICQANTLLRSCRHKREGTNPTTQKKTCLLFLLLLTNNCTNILDQAHLQEGALLWMLKATERHRRGRVKTASKMSLCLSAHLSFRVKHQTHTMFPRRNIPALLRSCPFTDDSLPFITFFRTLFSARSRKPSFIPEW